MRRSLIRLLGGQLSDARSHPATSMPALPPAPPAGIQPSQLLAQAERQFAYAELLSQQGCSDLAAPIYRQAYLGLRTLCGVREVARAEPQPVLPPSREPSPAGGVTEASTSLEAQLRPLRERLSSGTAADVEQQLVALLRQGHRHEDLTNLLGLTLLLQDRRDEAEKWFRETIRLNPRHHRALVNLGGLCLTTGRPEEAARLLASAIELTDPHSGETLAALTNLSLAQQQLGRPMEAAQLALRIFRIKPDHLRPESLAAAASTLEQMGEEEAAIELLRHLRQRGAGLDLIRRLAQLLERRGEFQEAAMVYRDLLTQPAATAVP